MYVSANAKDVSLNLYRYAEGSVWGGSDEGVMMAVACVECTLAVVFILAVRWLAVQQRETIAAIDVSNITLTDYSLKVDGLPKSGGSTRVNRSTYHVKPFYPSRETVLPIKPFHLSNISEYRYIKAASPRRRSGSSSPSSGACTWWC
jgi:hypothetical protein